MTARGRRLPLRIRGVFLRGQIFLKINQKVKDRQLCSHEQKYQVRMVSYFGEEIQKMLMS